MITSSQVASRALVVLAIDDDPDSLRLLELHLKCANGSSFETHAFTDWRLAASELRALRPDILIIDHHLAGTSGIDVYRHLVVQGHVAPAILITNRGEETLALDALQAGFSDCLPKSMITSNRLDQTIRSAVDKHVLRMDAARQEHAQDSLIHDLRRRSEDMQCVCRSLSRELKAPLASIAELSLALKGCIDQPGAAGLGASIATLCSATDEMGVHIAGMFESIEGAMAEDGAFSASTRPVPPEPAGSPLLDAP